jgi:hypothetical protein
MKHHFQAAALVTLLLAGCRAGANAGGDTSPPDTAPSAGQEPMTDSTSFRVSGSVRAVNVEGGCWRFDADDGRRFEIEKGSAPAGLLQDGRKATLTLKPRPDLMSSCMIGPIAEVLKVEP